MADQSTVQLPEIRPGMCIWMGRFRNRPGIISRVWTDEKGKPKYEVIPVPQGRKRPKERNLLPFKPMDAADSAKYRKIYDDEQREKRTKSARVVDRYLNATSEEVGMPAARGRKVWASEDGQHRVYEAEGNYQCQFRIGRSWYEDDSFPTFKDALRAVRMAMLK